jgi:transcriptional regulator with XRE-family HTH domain
MLGMAQNGLKAARKSLGITQEQMAERLGVSPPQISRWENGRDGIPSQRMAALCEAYQGGIDELLGAALHLPGTTNVVRNNAVPFRYEGAADVSLPRDVPIFGTSLGAPQDFDGTAIEQTTLNSGEVIGYLPRPTVLNGQRAVYGLYVQGGSMAPRFEDGDTLFAQDSRQGRPPRIGDDVIVYLVEMDGDDGERASAVLVKRLVRRTSDYIELEQFGPAAVFRIAVRQVLRIDRVIPWRELLS